MKSVWPKEIETGYAEAKRAQLNAHAPYSLYSVGAALKIKEHHNWILGCNVENSSYGGTICAERSALCSARSQFGSFTPEFLVLFTPIVGKAGSPCGLCLQSLVEFCPADFLIYLSDPSGLQQEVVLKEFLPRPFRSSDLLPNS